MSDSPAGRIHLSAPDVGPLEREAILRAFDSGWIAPAGAELDAFEEELRVETGAPAAVALSSGTGALRLGLETLGVVPGDEVVVASMTFAASAFPVVHAGAIPVFCDSEADSWCLDPNVLAEFLAQRAKVGKLPKVVMPVSIYGSAPNYAALTAVCDQYEIPILEDAAEALGSISTTGAIGSHGHPSVLSFNGNKIITTSSGGAFLGTPEQCDRVRFLSTQARQPTLHYEHEDIGFNFRLSNLLAALGRAQLARLERVIERCTHINDVYRSAFRSYTWCPYEFTERPNHWLSVAVLPDDLSPLDVIGALANENIEARPSWKPMHLQPVFADAEMIGSGAVAERLYDRGLCLPSGSVMDDDDLARVVDVVQSASGLA